MKFTAAGLTDLKEQIYLSIQFISQFQHVKNIIDMYY